MLVFGWRIGGAVKVRCGRIGTMESKDGASLGRLSLGLGGLRVGVGHVC